MSSLLVNTPRACRGTDTSFSWPTTPTAGDSYGRVPGDPRVDELVKKLEKACERVAGDEGISVMKEDPTSAVYIPHRVKEIVQECMSSSPNSSRYERVTAERGEGGEGQREVVRYVEVWREGGGKGGGGREGGGGGVRVEERVREEGELERVRGQLAMAQRENDELSQKYISVSERVEEIFRLKAEVSSLTYQRARLREDNSQLQQTLLDQETSFSYALRNCHSERMEREQVVGRLEEQVKQCQTRCRDLELQLSIKHTSVEQERDHLAMDIRKLQQELELEKMARREEVERGRREGREETERVRESLEREVEEVRREGEEKVEEVRREGEEKVEEVRREGEGRVEEARREGEENVLRVKREAEEIERTQHQELKEAVERADGEEQKVAELTLISEHLQQLLAESQTTGGRLTEDVHQLSLTLSQTQSRLRDLEKEQQSVQEQSVLSQQAHLSLALRDVTSVRRELALVTQAVQSDLHRGSCEVHHTSENLKTLLQMMTATHISEIENMRTSQGTEIQQIVSTHSSNIEQMRVSHDTEIERMRASLDTEIERMRASHDTEIEQMRVSHDTKTEQMRASHDSEIQQMRVSHDTEIEQMRASHDTEIEQMRTSHDTEIEQIVSTHSSNIEQMRALHDSEIQQMRASHDSEIQQMKESHDSEMQEAVCQLTSDKQSLQSELETMQRSMAEDNKQHELVLTAAEERERELRMTLTEMEAEKQRMEEHILKEKAEVEESCQRQRKIVLDKQNLEEEVKRLKLTNSHLVEEISELSLKLTDIKSHLEDELNERDRLTKEASSLTESLGHCKVTLHEAQQHRGTLNATIATIAHEKADLMREKVSLRVQVGTLEDELNALKRKFDLVNLERERLEQKVKDSERRVFLAELNRSVVSREGSTSNVSSTDLKRSLSTLLPHGNEGKQEACERLLGEYEPLYDTVAQMKRREMELQEELDKSHLHCETQMKTLRESHTKEIASVKRQQEETRATWKNEMQMLRKKLHEQQQQMQSQLREVQLEAARKSKGEHADDRAKWQSDLKALQTEFSSEKERASEADDKLVQLSAEHLCLSEQLISCQLQLKDAQNEMESLRESNALLLNSREEISSRMVKLADVNQALEQSLASKTEDLEKCRQQLQEIEAENERLRQSQLQYEEKSRQYSRDLVEMETQQSESQRHCEELQREKEDVKSALLIAQKENTSLESQLLAIKTDMASELETSQLCQSEAEGNYSRVLSVLVQVLEPDTGNPLHGVGGSTPTLKTKRFPDTSPEVLCQGIVKLKNERDELRKAVAQNTETLKQCRRDMECMRDEKCAVESQVQTLQSSLASLQASLEMISGQRNTAEVSRKEAQACLDALQTEKGDLEHQTSSLQRQLDSLNTANNALQQKCRELEQRLMEVETLKNTQAEETLQLKNMVSILKSSQLNKDRKLTELEQRFQSTQREMVEKEVDHRGTERSRSVLEQRLAHFEQSSARQEGTKKELQSRVQYLESQLTEIQEKAQCLRRDVQRLQRENLSLTGDVENLSKCLETTTREKQTLAQSLEMEIERLREEVGRLLHVNSSLKVQLVHNQGSHSPLCMDPAVDGLLSASRTQLQSVQMSSSAESCGTSPEECTEDWQGQCFKYRTAVHQLKRKVKYLERKLSATKLSPQPTDGSVQQFSGKGTDTLHHTLVVHSPTTHTDQQVEGDVSPHATSTPSKPSTFS